jgi:hypothetical protein
MRATCPTRRQPSRLGLLAALALSGSAGAAAAQTHPEWPTYAFEVQLNPAGIAGALQGLFSLGAEQELAQPIAEMESYFSDAARHLQKQGFRAPVMARGDRGYVVNLFDYDDFNSDGEIAVARADFDGETCTLRIDLSRAFVDGRMEERLLEHAGHELFHCVQNAYPLFAVNWDIGDWIAEATAQAVGQELLWQLRGIEFSRRNAIQRWGGRFYNLPLATRASGLPGNFHYYTESLWRYIGEHVAAKARGGRAGVEELRFNGERVYADYSYLDSLFQVSLAGAGEAAELTWADEGLADVVGIGLDRLYANFVSTFAAYVPARAELSAATSPEQAVERWLEYVYGECQVAELDVDAPVAVVELDLQPVSAQCVTLRSSVADQVDVSIHTRSESRDALRSLVIGVGDGTVVRQLGVSGSPVAGGLIGDVTLRLSMNPQQTLIVSNVFEDVAATRRQRISLTLNVNAFETSVTAPTPEARPATTAVRAAPDPVLAAAANQVATGVAALSAHARNGLSVGFDPDAAPCPEPFRFEPCGPTTTVNLSLSPGAAGGFGAASGTGGDLGQFLTTLGGVAANGIAETEQGLAAAAQAIGRTKGSTVHITMPAIDYGFTGSLSNVYIRVNGDGGDDLLSIEPRDVIPGPGRGFPLSGRVTIEEFTPFVMRGRFSAAVVNTSRVGEDLGDDPAFEISDQIDGRFVIGGPWQNDARAQRLQTEDPFELAAQDLAEFAPLQGMDIAALARAASAGAPTSGQATGFSVLPISAFPSCSCGCQPLENVAPACRPICEVAARHCAVIDRFGTADAGAAAREAEIATASDGLREQFGAFMRSQNFDPAFQESLLGAFDQQTSVREQRNFVRSFGMPLEQTPSEIDPEVERVLSLTRDEYRAELVARGVPAALHAELLEAFDEMKRRQGN